MKFSEKKMKKKFDDRNINEVNVDEMIQDDQIMSPKKKKKSKKSKPELESITSTEPATVVDDSKPRKKKKYGNILPTMDKSKNEINIENGNNHEIEESNDHIDVESSPKKKKCKKSKQKNMESGDQDESEKKRKYEGVMQVEEISDKKNKKRSKRGKHAREQLDIEINNTNDGGDKIEEKEEYEEVALSGELLDTKEKKRKRKRKHTGEQLDVEINDTNDGGDKIEEKREYEEVTLSGELLDTREKKRKRKRKHTGEQLDVEINDTNDGDDKIEEKRECEEAMQSEELLDTKGNKRSKKKKCAGHPLEDVSINGTNNYEIKKRKYEEIMQVEEILNAKDKRKKGKPDKQLEDIESKVNDGKEQKDASLLKKQRNRGIDKKMKNMNQRVRNTGNEKVVLKDGFKFLVIKLGSNTVFDICFEDENMIKFQNFYVKPQHFEELSQMEKSLKEEGLNKEEVAHQLKSKEQIFHHQLKMEAFGYLLSELNEEEKLLLKIEMASLEGKTNNTDNQKDVKFEYKENELMTCFEGVWILKKDLPRVQNLCAEYISKIIKGKKDGNTDVNLTPEEKHVYKKLMERLKKEEAERLRMKLDKNYNEVEENKPTESMPSSVDDQENGNTENQSGTSCFKSGSGLSCHNCNEKGHISQDCPKKSEIRCTVCGSEYHMRFYCSSMKSRGGRSHYRGNKTIDRRVARSGSRGGSYYNCNQVGHMSRDCPEEKSGSGGTGSSCYNCNQVGHMSRDCPEKRSGSGGTGSSCYNCNQVGHMSRDCPEKRSGSGGGNACYNCNQVGHMSRDCTENRNEDRRNSGNSRFGQDRGGRFSRE